LPGSFVTAAVEFPRLNEYRNDSEKIAALADYLFRFEEQLRYTLSNLGRDNLNRTELGEISGETTAPVYEELDKAEAEIAALQATVRSISARLSGAEDAVMGLSETVAGLDTELDEAAERIGAAEERLETLSDGLAELAARVQRQETDTAALTASLAALDVRVRALEDAGTE